MDQGLSDDEVEACLRHLPGWEAQGWKSTEQIRKLFRVPDVKIALGFAQAVAELATGAEHRIGFYIDHRHVSISLGAKGAVTPEDIALASRIEEETGQFPAIVPRIPRWPKRPGR